MNLTKRKILKAATLVTAAVLAALCCIMLAACNKHKQNVEDDAALRQTSVTRVSNALLSSLGEGWEAGLSDEQILKLDDAGEYVVARGVADFAADILKKSELLTGKLKVLADAVESEDGKALLADFDSNLDRIVPIFNMVDFTRDDVSGLFYLLLTSLVSDSGNVMNGILARLQALRSLPGVGTSAGRASIDGAITTINSARDTLVPKGDAKAELLGALEGAKGAITNLIAFVYNMSSSAFTDEMLENMLTGDGALSDVTDAELSTIVNALSQNIVELKDSLTDSELEKLDKAIGLVIANFDKDFLPSALYSQLYAQVVQFAKYANMVVGVIPFMCDMATSAAELFKTTQFVEQFRTVVAGSADSDSVAYGLNTTIFASKIIVEIMNSFTRDKFVSVVNNIRAQGKADYQKTVPAIIIDLILNLSVNIGVENDEDLLLPVHKDIMDDSYLENMVNIIGFHFNIGKFRQTYYLYQNGLATLIDLVSAANRCNFEDLGAHNSVDLGSSVNDELIRLWYESYNVTGVSKVQQLNLALNEKICDDLIAFLDDYYNSPDRRKLLEDLANREFLTAEPDEETAQQYVQTVLDSGAGGFIILLSLLFQLIA